MDIRILNALKMAKENHYLDKEEHIYLDKSADLLDKFISLLPEQNTFSIREVGYDNQGCIYAEWMDIYGSLNIDIDDEGLLSYAIIYEHETFSIKAHGHFDFSPTEDIDKKLLMYINLFAHP